MSVSCVGFPILLQIFIENIVHIHNGHHIFLKTLESLYTACSFINNSTDVILALLSISRDAYISFLSHFSETLEVLDEFAEKAFEAIPASSLVHGKRLLFNFAKRLQAYFDLAKTMIEILPDSFPDHDGFRAVKAQLEEIFTQVENRKAFLESRKQIEFIIKHTNWSVLPQVSFDSRTIVLLEYWKHVRFLSLFQEYH